MCHLHFVYIMMHMFVCIVVCPWVLQNGNTLRQAKHARMLSDTIFLKFCTIVRSVVFVAPQKRTSVERRGVRKQYEQKKNQRKCWASLICSYETIKLVLGPPLHLTKSSTLTIRHLNINLLRECKYTIMISSSIVWHVLDNIVVYEDSFFQPLLYLGSTSNQRCNIKYVLKT